MLPEEEVRQAMVEFLLNQLAVPRSLIEVEFALARIQPGIKDRLDIVVWKPSKEKGLEPWLIVECKQPKVVLTIQALAQASRYLKKLAARYVCITNGVSSLYYMRTSSNEYQPIAGLPQFSS